MTEKSIFNGMTNLYSVTKTLRFELKPTPETLENMKENQVLVKDKKKEAAYRLIKPLLDKLHEEFITNSLTNKKIDWQPLYDLLLNYINEKDKDKKKALIEKWWSLFKAYELYRKKIAEELWWYEQLLGKWIIEILHSKFDDDITPRILEYRWEQYRMTPKEIINEFDKFTTYFSWFNQNRKNYYADDEKDTAIASRVVHENFPKFAANVSLYKNGKNDFNQMKNFLKNQWVEVVNKEWKTLYEVDPATFEVNYFNYCLTQKGIELYNTYIWDINLLINLYNQQKRKQDSSFKNLSQMSILYKQIWCGKKMAYIETIEDPSQLQWQINQLILVSEKKNKKIELLMNSLQSRQDLSQIYFSQKALTYLSNQFFGSWFRIWELLEWEKWQKKRKTRSADNGSKIPSSISLEKLFEALDSTEEFFFKENLLSHQKASNSQTFLALIIEEFNKYYSNGSVLENEVNGDKQEAIMPWWIESKNNLQHILAADLDETNQEHKDLIKTFADNCLALFQMAKWFVVKPSKVDGMDSNFYNELGWILEDYHCAKRYDILRNYLTRKPYGEEKMKLNFENPTLLGGWDQSKESDNSWVIVRDENIYYLAVMKKWNNKFFDESDNKALYDKDNYGLQKMIYKQMSDPSKDIPNLIEINWTTVRKTWRKDPDWVNRRLEEIKNKYLPTEINAIRTSKSYLRSSESFNIDDLSKYINYYKQRLSDYHKDTFDFNFKPHYQDWNDFTKHIARQTYLLKRQSINKSVLDQAVGKWDIYLFQIANKDFNKKNKNWEASENLHTTYRKAIFYQSESPIKLNWEAELFYRPPTIKEPEKEKVKTSSGKIIEHTIKKARYTTEKFLFHASVTLNFWSQWESVNQKLNKNIKESNNVCVLWIDRWEKHLLYYSLVDSQWVLLKQWSFNTITLQDSKIVDFNRLLAKRSSEMMSWRKDRKTVGSIKELKAWYLSQVVHEICTLMIEKNAVVVMEDLNFEFKSKRWSIVEKAVYRKFELALAKKLNFLIQKSKQSDENWWVRKAFQLTPENKSDNVSIFEKSKQRWALLYTSPQYTSTTDPTTWRRKHLHINNVATAEKIKEFFTRTCPITGYRDIHKLCYRFDYIHQERHWSLYAYKGLERYRYDTETKSLKYYNMYDEYTKLFGSFDVSQELFAQVSIQDKFSWKRFVFLRNLLNQIRNTDKSKSWNENDFVQSPVLNKYGYFFDSRKVKDSSLPYNGDANGAYNIARKWLMMLQRIKDDSWTLFISDKQWDEYVINV